jgi:flagellar protein FlbD
MGWVSDPRTGHRSTPGTDLVIHLTRLNGPGFALNPDLIQKAEATPDTVVTLVDGTKYVVSEPLDLLMERVLTHRASVVALAQHLAHVAQEAEPTDEGTIADAVPLRPRRRV